jgi:tetratricopeptide (TPR) repeat protein
MDTEALYNEALKHQDDGNLSVAASCFNDLIANHTDTRFHSAYGYCLQELGYWEQSIVQFLIALDLKPSYCESDTRLALAESYQKLGQLEMAIEQWHIVAKMTPTYPSYELTIEAAKSLLREYT